MYLGKLKFKTIDYIVDNLCPEAIEEMKCFFKNNAKSQTKRYLNLIPKKYIQVIYLKQTKEPVAIFGLVPQSSTSAGIFFLSTDKLKQGNMILFLKESKKVVRKWEKQYKLLMDSAYKKNKLVVKWLKFMGFEPSQYEFEEFQIYFKGDINEY